MRAIIFLLAGVCWQMSPALYAGEEEDLPTISNFSLPEYDDEGNKTSEMTGEYATIHMKQGEIEIINVRVEFYKNGETEVIMTSPKCRYNQRMGVAYSRSNIHMQKDNMVVTGTGFAWSRTNEIFKIFSDAKLVIKNFRKDVAQAEDSP